MRVSWRLPVVRGLGLSMLLWTGMAHCAPDPGARPDPARFDALVRELERGERVPVGADEVAATLAQLDALRPPGDALRELRVRLARCDFVEFPSPGEGLAFARRGLDDAQRLGAVGAQIGFRLCEAAYVDAGGQVGGSLEPTEAALALARTHDDPRLLALALGRRGNLHSLQGRQAAALTDFLEVQRVLRDAGHLLEAEANLHEVAIAYRRMGDHARALDYLAESVAFAERQQRWGLLAVSLIQTGFAHEDRGEPALAVEAQRQGASVAAAHGLHYEHAAAHMGLASALLKLGRAEAAQDALAVARRGFARFGDRANAPMLHLLEGQARAAGGDHSGALAHYRLAARAFEADPNPRYEALLHAARARSHEALGDFPAALAHLKRELAGRQHGYEEARLQYSLLAQYQFDTARRELEHAQLQAEQRSQQQRLEAIERANRWQLAALLSSGLLLALLLWLLLLQLRRLRRVRTLALTDTLTGVANRRQAEAAAAAAVQRARRHDRPLAVLAIDLDGFKQINDRHGHGQGDQVLVRVARAGQAALREADLFARMGGEEFMGLLADTDAATAAATADRLRAAIANLALDDLVPGLRVTASIGVAMLDPDDDGPAPVLARADAALYLAKATGRNRVEVAPAPDTADPAAALPAAGAGTPASPR